jgi:hypothetical protein
MSDSESNVHNIRAGKEERVAVTVADELNEAIGHARAGIYQLACDPNL